MRITDTICFSEKDVENIRKAQIELLTYLKTICEEHALKWWLCSGSLLGAIRHNGYIPWDDDIDLCMPREDYVKFLDLFEGGYYNKETRFFLQSYRSEKSFPFNYSKLRFEKSVFREMSMQNLNIHHGIYIDIYPLDHIPNKKNQLFFYFLKCSIARARRNQGLFLPKPMYKPKSFKGKCFVLLAWMMTFFISKKRLTAMNEKYLFKMNEKCKTLDKVVLNSDLRVKYSIKDFEQTKKWPFENVYVNVPSGYDSILKLQYGDYLTPPPNSKRVMHHYCVEYSEPVFK